MDTIIPRQDYYQNLIMDGVDGTGKLSIKKRKSSQHALGALGSGSLAFLLFITGEMGGLVFVILVVFIIELALTIQDSEQDNEKQYEKFCGFVSLLSTSSELYRIISNYQRTEQREEFLYSILSEYGINLENNDLSLLLVAHHYLERRNRIEEQLKPELDALKNSQHEDQKQKSIKNLVLEFYQLFGEDYKSYLRELVEILNPYELEDTGYVSLCESIEKNKENIALAKYHQQLLSENPIETLDIGKIDEMNGYEFESFLCELFKNMGYKVVSTPLAGDQGADLIIEKNNERSVVQAKCYSGKVGNKAVQEIVGSKRLYHAVNAFVVTNSFFTNAAVEMAVANGVALVDRDKLIDWMRTYL